MFVPTRSAAVLHQNMEIERTTAEPEQQRPLPHTPSHTPVPKRANATRRSADHLDATRRVAWPAI